MTKRQGRIRMTEDRKERSPLAAAFLSLVVVGLGQLYNGQHRRAVVLYVLSILLAALALTAWSFFVSLQGIVAFYLVLLAALCVKAFSIFDAYSGARRIGVLELKRYNRWYIYLAIFLVPAGISEFFEYPVASYSIPSGAMRPTLLTGDYVRVRKFSDTDRTPERGDIAVFWKPGQENIEYIKRIVGLPGDRIQMIGGVLHIDAKPVTREQIEDFEFTDRYYGPELSAQYVETLPNSRAHRILEAQGDTGQLDATKEYTVPEGHFFALGDNRDNSADSRVIGFVPAENLIGRAKILFFSVDHEFSWWRVWRWPSTIRFERIGGIIN